MNVNLKNKKTNQLIQAKVGFSWTTFFFGFFPALFRGDWKWALIMFITSLITVGISSIVFAFIYNKIYINNLLSKDYIPCDESSRHILVNKGFLSNNALSN
ncbi:hypothetical protein FDF74_09785 [Clostridium niameyense]|uniref:DUF2628 domain-containing protein n=1 Tax=Clostridium niameyense TaxID=1622073 RepID=A0A6M0RB16_9CLOT|nr:hypothetical protein [Clostridium niameyense]NEZ47481.1 hypothetical protein [Clostridium niameyense]